MDHSWLRKWPVTKVAPNHYLNKDWSAIQTLTITCNDGLLIISTYDTLILCYHMHMWHSHTMLSYAHVTLSYYVLICTCDTLILCYHMHMWHSHTMLSYAHVTLSYYVIICTCDTLILCYHMHMWHSHTMLSYARVTLSYYVIICTCDTLILCYHMVYGNSEIEKIDCTATELCPPLTAPPPKKNNKKNHSNSVWSWMPYLSYNSHNHINVKNQKVLGRPRLWQMKEQSTFDECKTDAYHSSLMYGSVDTVGYHCNAFQYNTISYTPRQ